MKKRKNIRLKNYNYSSPGYYFITICTKNKKYYFRNEVITQIINNCWNAIPEHFNNIKLDEFIIMPNHIHGIIIINSRGRIYPAPTETPTYKKSNSNKILPIVISTFKAAITRKLNPIIENFKWQRSYYEHIIRNDIELDNIRRYINENPIKWNEDIENLGIKIDLKEYYKNIYKGEF